MTTPTPPPIAIFLVFGLMAVAATIQGLDAAHGVFAEAIASAPRSRDAVLDGRFARRIDRHFETDSWTMRRFRPYWNEAMLELFHETPSRVAVGRDDWLFLTPSLRRLQPADSRREWAVHHAIIDFMRQSFERPGTRVCVLVMPAKWRLYEEQLRGPRVTADRRALYDLILTELRGKGIDAPDVLAALRAERERRPDVLLYPPNDTHLSHAGFRFVTETFLPRLTDTAPHAARARLDALPRDESYRHHSDMLAVMNIRPDGLVGRAWSYPEVALVAPPTANRPGSDVLIFGDSFFRQYDGIFQRLIQVASGLDVDARHSGWAHVNHRRMLADYATHPPRLVLIALTERRFAAG